MVETQATGRSFPGWQDVAEDIVPEADDTYDLGADDKRWAYIYAAIAILTSMTIGGIYLGATSEGFFFINATTQINGSLNVSGDMDVDGILTAGNATIENLNIENLNFSNLTITGDIFNISATTTYVGGDLLPDEYCVNDFGSNALRWSSAFFCENITASYYFGDGSQLTNLPSGDNASWNESLANTLYYGISNPSNFWNDSSSGFNKTYADTLYAILGYGDDWNKTYADTLYADISLVGDNESWNESRANTLYAPNTTIGIQYLINDTGVYRTDNLTYTNYAYNVSLNYTGITFDAYDSRWTSTYNGSYVPYSGATSNVNLGIYNLTAGGLNITGNSYFSGDLFPQVTLTSDIGSGSSRWDWLYVRNISSENIAISESLSIGQNITAIDCIIFDSGGKICSGS